jgi:hypothetical protein
VGSSCGEGKEKGEMAWRKGRKMLAPVLVEKMERQPAKMG